MPERRAVFQLTNNDDTWFLSGTQYARIQLVEDTVTYGPVDLPGNWQTFVAVGWNTADGFLRVDSPASSAINAYVFSGNHVIDISVSSSAPYNDTLVSGPFVIAERWLALGQVGFTHVDAAFFAAGSARDTKGGQAWFFRGNECVLIKFSDETTSIVQGPNLINATWASLQQVGFHSVDCTLETQKPNELWVFSGPTAVLIDVGRDEVIDGPVAIATKFTSLHTAGFY